MKKEQEKTKDTNAKIHVVAKYVGNTCTKGEHTNIRQFKEKK